MNTENRVLSFLDFFPGKPLPESLTQKPKAKKKYKIVRKKMSDSTSVAEEYVKVIPETDLLTTKAEVKKVNESLFSEAVYADSPESKSPETVRQYSEDYVKSLIKSAQEAKAEKADTVQELEPINEGINYEDSSEYKIIKDKDENFECKISVEGTTLNEAKARLVMDSEPWNLTFYGKIYPDGRCIIPLKKGLPLGEGSTGKMRLEVIAEDQLFVGWESDFVVEVSKKLNVEVKEQKKVKVSFSPIN